METTMYTSKTLDYLGLIAGLIREIGISELIDSCYADQSPDQIVSNGKALEAMIINGLGFVNKRLYLVPRFYEDKPICNRPANYILQFPNAVSTFAKKARYEKAANSRRDGAGVIGV